MLCTMPTTPKRMCLLVTTALVVGQAGGTFLQYIVIPTGACVFKMKAPVTPRGTDGIGIQLINFRTFGGMTSAGYRLPNTWIMSCASAFIACLKTISNRYVRHCVHGGEQRISPTLQVNTESQDRGMKEEDSKSKRDPREPKEQGPLHGGDGKKR